MDGNILLLIGAYSWGNSTLSFSAQDDGGTDFGGQNKSLILQNITLIIVPVNTRPTIGSSGTIFMWVNPYDSIFQEKTFFLVVQMCCSPCAGPKPCGYLHEPDSSCGCSAPDAFGTLYTRSRFNSSAGPYEEDTQTLTFFITEDRNSGLIDPRYPLLVNPNGALVLKQTPEASGVTDFSISALDDGGVDDSPHQVTQNNRTQHLRLYVLYGFVSVTLNVKGSVFHDLAWEIDREIEREEVCTSTTTRVGSAW